MLIQFNIHLFFMIILHIILHILLTLVFSTNDQEPTLDHLREAQRTLTAEQQELSLRAGSCTSSLNCLNKRLLLFERHLIALSRSEECEGGVSGEVREGGEEEEGEVEKMDKERVREEEDSGCVCLCVHVHARAHNVMLTCVCVCL